MDDLEFRPLTAGDLEVVHAMHADPATNLFNPYGASRDAAASGRMLQNWLRHREQHGFGYDLVVQGGEVVGICGVRGDVWQGLAVLNLYWRILPAWQGRGLAGRAGAHALAEARAVTPPGTIVARMMDGNTASSRVAERLGLHRRPDLDGDLSGAHWIVYVDGAPPAAAPPLTPGGAQGS